MTEIRPPDPKGENNLDALLAMLRSLRLREMADDLTGLLEESARDGWGQLELLFELFQREDVRKHQRRDERNLKASRLSDYGIEHFDFDLAREHGLEPSLVRDLAQCEFVRARRNLILAGGVGTGKTYLARTLGREALKRGFKVFVFNTADLLGMLFSKRVVSVLEDLQCCQNSHGRRDACRHHSRYAPLLSLADREGPDQVRGR